MRDAAPVTHAACVSRIMEAITPNKASSTEYMQGRAMFTHAMARHARCDAPERQEHTNFSCCNLPG